MPERLESFYIYVGELSSYLKGDIFITGSLKAVNVNEKIALKKCDLKSKKMTLN